MRKAGEEYRTKLKERLERKLEYADEKREARLINLQERIRKHVRQHPRHSIMHSSSSTAI